MADPSGPSLTDQITQAIAHDHEAHLQHPSSTSDEAADPTATTTATGNPDTDPTDFLMTYLTSTRKIDKLHSSLFNSLSRLGWTQRVRSLAFELIRTRRCTRFEQVVDKIVDMAATGGENDEEEERENGVLENGSLSGQKRKRGHEEQEKTLSNGNEMNEPEKKKPKSKGNNNNNTNKNTHESKDDDGKRNAKEKPTATTNGESEVDNPNKPPATVPPTPTTDAASLLAEFDVRIPPTVVSQGAKFLRETLDDLYVWGGDADEYLVPNGYGNGNVENTSPAPSVDFTGFVLGSQDEEEGEQGAEKDSTTAVADKEGKKKSTKDKKGVGGS